jgi:hypothetical protein
VGGKEEQEEQEEQDGWKRGRLIETMHTASSGSVSDSGSSVVLVVVEVDGVSDGGSSGGCQ